MVPRAAPLADIRSRREVALHLEALAVRAGARPIDGRIRLKRNVSGSCRAPAERVDVVLGARKSKKYVLWAKGAVEARNDRAYRGQKDSLGGDQGRCPIATGDCLREEQERETSGGHAGER